MKEIIIGKNHRAFKVLDEVHDNITQAIETSVLLKGLEADVKRAETMEKYLRDFKQMTNATPIKGNFLEESLKQEVYEDIGNKINEMTHTKGRLFNKLHEKYYQEAKAMGADDIFELELKYFLEEGLKKATGLKDVDFSGIGVVGKEGGFLNLTEALQKSTESVAAKIKTKDFDNIQVRAGKVDVNSFNVSMELIASLSGYWKGFVEAFNGARFTVKNYNGKAKQEDIHLGESDLRKAIIAPLNFYGGASLETATHIYTHSVAIIDKRLKSADKVGQHILHLRFAYELAGEGLVTKDGDNLKGADFFIYNDPTSNNIYVRSTKAMIKEYMEKGFKNMQNPLTSKIAISKASFA